MKKLYALAFSILLVIVLILWIGPSNIINALKTANWNLICLALFIHLLAVGMRSLRWGFIINRTWDFKDNYVVKTIGLFAGNFSPVRTAGEPVTALIGKKINHISMSKGLSAGLTERFFDMLISGILLALACLFLPKVRVIALIGALVCIVLVAVFYIINWRENSSVTIYKKIHPLIEKLPINEEVVDGFYHKAIDGLASMVEYSHSFTNSKNVIIVFILSMFCWLLECIRLYVVFAAFNVEITLMAVIAIFLLANIIGVISALPGGIGSIELSLTGLFLIFGVSQAIAGSIALVDRLVSFWLVTVLGLIFTSIYARDLLDEIKGFYKS
jgi:glycosyltransferase 2 family protein